MLRSKSRYVVAFLALALLPGGARSEEDRKAEDEQKLPALVETWLSRLRTAEEHLRAGNHRQARAIADELERQMLDSIEGGPGVGALLARTLVARSFAEAGLGRMRDAAWDWHMARAVYPELSDDVLTQAGEVGQELLAALTIPSKTGSEKTATGAPSQPADQGQKGRVSPPKKISGDSPIYPYALRDACVVGQVMVESLIDEHGDLQQPRVLASPGPLLSLASLETLRTWQFKPARFQGKPVEVYYSLTVNYSLTECHQTRKRAAG